MMTRFRTPSLACAATLAVLLCAHAQSGPATPSPTPSPDPATPAAAASETPAPDAAPAATRSLDERQIPTDSRGNAGTGTPAADNRPPGGEPSLRLNFRGVPLEMVLDYLSDAAGFIIILDAEVRGKVDVWSNQPLNREEAVDLLNTVLAKNGYTALRNGRTLTIVSRDDARKRDIPVRAGNDPTQIPKSEEIVTQIIPVKFINAVQLNRDLAGLIPSTATMAANEGGNAIVMTDTLTNIRRFTEIVHALDTSIAAVSAVQVFPLKFADAKALATVVRDLFTSTDSGRSGNQQQQQQVFRGFRGGGPGGGFPGMPGGGGSTSQGSSGSARVASPRVVAVADERSNSLVVSAPTEQMTVIRDLVEQVDTNIEDVTELRVFRLAHSDPQEMAEVIAGLFPDPTTSNSQGGRGSFRFGGPFGGFGGNRGGGASPTGSSERLLKQSKVIAVPDLRTSSIVVSASRELMEQIATMVDRLDSDPARKQKVFVYSVENTDPTAVEEILRGLFEGQNARNRSTTRNNNRQTGNQLNNRATQSQNQGRRNTSGFGTGNSGFGQVNR